MNKDQLQKELKDKVKPEIKPSDLKKKRTISIPTRPASPIIVPIDSRDNKKEPNQKKDQINQLQENANEFNQLNELQKKQLTDYNKLLTKYAKNDKIALENYI